MVQVYRICMQQVLLASRPMGDSIGALLVGLSDAHAWTRTLMRDWQLGSDSDVWEAPERFERNTTKYWLRPQDAMAFKAEMIRHVPILIYGSRPRLAGTRNADPDAMCWKNESGCHSRSG